MTDAETRILYDLCDRFRAQLADCPPEHQEAWHSAIDILVGYAISEHGIPAERLKRP